MSKIWQLYTEARMSGQSTDVASYNEAVASLPAGDFLTEAEYIIRSSVGLSHFRPLCEKYGLSIPFAMKCESILEDSIEKCREQNLDSTAFTEALSYLKERRNRYQPLYDMYEWYSLGDEDEYLKTYYGSMKGKSNRLYPEKMIMFGEEAIPDLIITAYEKDNLQRLLEYYSEEWSSNDGIFCEWMMRGLNRIADRDLIRPYYENACSTIVNQFQERKQKEYRESVLLHQEFDPVMTGEERIALDEQIRFLEFGLTNPDLDSKTVDSISKQIYSLYEDGSKDDTPSADPPKDEKESKKSKKKLKPVFMILKSYFMENERQEDIEKNGENEHNSFKNPFPIIHHISRGDNYGHAIIAFDLDLKNSFEVFQYGLIRTQIDESWKGTKNIYINVLYVPSDDYDRMLNKCEDLLKDQASTHYAFSDFIKAYIGKPIKDPGHHHICSAFVGYILGMSTPKNLHRDYTRLKPEDLTLCPRCFHLADCRNIDDFQAKLPELKKKVNEIYDEHEEELNEYNNELPKLMLKEQIDKHGAFDKLVDGVFEKMLKIDQQRKDRGLIEEWEDDELSNFSIFREAGDDMGIMYDSYAPLGKVMVDFITPLRKLISSFNKDPAKVEVSLDDQIKAFKEKINIKPIAKEIDIRKIGPLKKKVFNFQRTVENCLKSYSACKNEMSYGGNLWRSIIKRPKVMTKNIDSEEYDKINSGIRQINRALDWFEKAIIDVSNLASQDINILNLVDKVYRRQNIYEAAVPRMDWDKKLPDSGLASDFIIRNLGDPGSVINHPTHSTPTRKSQVPGYLRDAHSIADWGEEDDDSSDESLERKAEREEKEDDFKRPSASNDSQSNNTSPEDTTPPPVKKPEEPAKPSGGVNNYYYYTYTNSLNRNQGSFNTTTDNSTDRSVKNTDRSSHVKDDHSSNINNSKTNNSRVVTSTDARATQTGSNYINSNKSEEDKKKPSQFHQVESTHMPWEIKHFFEAIGDADNDRPQSDHPIKDTLMDIDRATVKYQQAAKKTVQDVQNVGRAAAKPMKRTGLWMKKVISDWRDKDETALKEKMADPHARDNLFGAIKTSIKYGALWQAGLLLNPVWAFLAIRAKYNQFKNRDRIRNEIIQELKTEIKILDEKIRYAEAKRDMKSKYQLMRFQGELQKKMIRVGAKGMEKYF